MAILFIALGCGVFFLLQIAVSYLDAKRDPEKLRRKRNWIIFGGTPVLAFAYLSFPGELLDPSRLFMVGTGIYLMLSSWLAAWLAAWLAERLVRTHK